MRRGAGIAAMVGVLFFMLGCGSSGGSGNVRFMQASPDAPAVDLLINGKTQAYGLTYGNASAYISVGGGSQNLQAVPVNSTSPLFSVSVPIASSGNTTVLMTGLTSGLKSLVLTDGGTAAVTGSGYVRVINASVSMGAADIYLLPAGSTLTGATPIATSVGFNGNPGYHVVPGGDYEVFMTTPGTLNVLLDTGPINLAASQNATLVVLDGTSGGFTFTVLQDQ